MSDIHQTALVEPGAELGADVEIGPFSVIYGGARIGDKTVIGPHAVIHSHTTIGAGCVIHANAVLGDLPQDMAFKKDVESYVQIGSNCIIREGVTIHRGTKAESSTIVGESCFLMANSHLAHNVRLGNRVIIANGSLLAGYVEVGDMAFISGNCVIHQFVRIGRLVMLGGACAIGKDVPPYCMTRPHGENKITGLNIVGMRRAGIKPEQRLEIKHVFNLLYLSGLNISEAVNRIKREHASGVAMEIIGFIEASERGICTLSADSIR